MTAKEKAIDLVDKYSDSGLVSILYGLDESDAVECAKLTVDEIIEAFSLYGNDLMGEINYWNEVKQELEKL